MRFGHQSLGRVTVVVVALTLSGCGRAPSEPQAPPPGPTPRADAEATSRSEPKQTRTAADAITERDTVTAFPEMGDVNPAAVAAALTDAMSGCAAGEAERCLLAAGFHQRGVGTPRDLKRADALYRRTCELKEARGCFIAGGFARDGRLGAPNEADAIALLGRGCDLGHGDSCSGLGLVLGGPDGEQRHDGMRAAFERACELGVGSGCFVAGLIQDEGKGVPRDPKAALAFYEKGCELKDGPACANAGGSLVGGAGAAGRADGERALDYLERACALEAANECGMLGVVYAQGKLVSKDMAKAERMLRKACELGFRPACGMTE